MDSAQARPPRAAPTPTGGEAAPQDPGEESAGEEDVGFVMPEDSEPESASSAGGDRTRMPARATSPADALPGRPRPAPLSRGNPEPHIEVAARPRQVGQGVRSRAPEGSSRPDEPDESAADFVERMKRDLQLQGPPVAAAAPPPLAPAIGTDSPASSAVPSGRARNGDPVRFAAPGARDGAPAGAGVRARSSDPRVYVAKASAAESARSSDEEESEDDAAPPPPGGVPAWKADVKALVQDFAKQERSKPRPRGDSGGGGGGPPLKRPPRAPIPAAASPAAQAAGAGSSPADRRRAQDPEDTRASRKPRVVEYTPATVEGYKQKYGQEVKLGVLGPDLDDERLLMKKAVAEKVKQFSKELHRVNRHRSASVPAKPPPKAEPKPTARSKALEFAKELPKPRPKPKEKQAEAPKAPTEADLQRADLEEIRQREIQHFEDVARAGQIKDFLKQLPY